MQGLWKFFHSLTLAVTLARQKTERKTENMINKIIGFFKNFYGVVNEETEILDGTYFHEDCFRQVEFCPKENIELLKSENNEVNKFAEEHSDGSGFTEIYIREENNQKTILDKQIKLSNLNSMLLNLELEKIEKVYTGYSSLREICEDTVAYKYDEAEIFVTSENNFVKDFFITGFRFYENEDIKKKLEEILHKIGTEYDLILNDWDLSEIIDLNDRKEIQKYLNEEF